MYKAENISCISNQTTLAGGVCAIEAILKRKGTVFYRISLFIGYWIGCFQGSWQVFLGGGIVFEVISSEGGLGVSVSHRGDILSEKGF